MIKRQFVLMTCALKTCHGFERTTHRSPAWFSQRILLLTLVCWLAPGGRLLAAQDETGAIPPGPILSAASQTTRPSAVPRDLNAGYLLNANFWALNTYISPNVRKLSGWEADCSGGSFTHNGLNVNGPPGSSATFFNWFRIDDTNSAAAVSLKHRIASQSFGKITLEYRIEFVTNKMEGVEVQLLHGTNKAVNIITADGSLCYENSSGTPVALQPYAAGEAYGIRVVADLASGTASIYVNGPLRAANAAFCNRVSAIDAVMIKTGAAATGSLYLSPVDVHKGFLVCEKFLSGATGAIPADWTRATAGGSVSVEELHCAPRPDIYSVKLSDTNAAASVSCGTSFARSTNALVFWFSFLLPSKMDGVAAELRDRNSTAVQMVTQGGNLCSLNAAGAPVVVVSNYLANLWYLVKIVAHPQAATADFFVNGKLAVANAPFNHPVRGFDNIRFSTAEAGTGVMWVDDVKVHPYFDYPSDYVPAPAPVANSTLNVGIQSCNLWREGAGYGGWQWVEDETSGKRFPYLGYFDEGNPEVTDWQIKWQVEHGINFELHCWYRSDNAFGNPIKRTPFDHEIIDGLFNARYKPLKKFMIMWEDNLFGYTDSKDFRANLVPFWIEYFFKDPSYLKIDNKPVISSYENSLDPNNFPGGPQAEADYLRKQCIKAGFAGCIILHEYRQSDPATIRNFKNSGIDYFYAYTWATASTNSQQKGNLAQRDAAAGVGGIGMIPSVAIGWDTHAWQNADGMTGCLAAGDYQGLLHWLKHSFLPTMPTNQLGANLVLLGNWNEFGEGHALMPSTLVGFGYLDAIRDVFTAGGAHTDLTPSARQQARLDVLCPYRWGWTFPRPLVEGK